MCYFLNSVSGLLWQAHGRYISFSLDLINVKLSGGIDENGEKKRLESLNFETMEWTRLGDMFTERSDCACTTFKDDLIVAGLLLILI